LWRFSFIRFLRLCLAIFAFRRFLSEPMSDVDEVAFGDLRAVRKAGVPVERNRRFGESAIWRLNEIGPSFECQRLSRLYP
jgi:hypothetical protein